MVRPGLQGLRSCREHGAYGPVMGAAPCEEACAADEPVRTWLNLLQWGRPRRAWELITRTNPLPACMGRICYASCQARCVLAGRSGSRGAVGIQALEAAVGEAALREGWAFEADSPPTGMRMAVVGSGPCGLSAAHQLVRLGHEVVLFEAHHALGGMLRRGIPVQRLPRWILDGEISRLVADRVEVRLSAPVLRIEQALEDSDGVIWAAGASRCMAVVEGATIWRQPIHTEGAQRRTATLSIGRGARAAAALSGYLLGEPDAPGAACDPTAVFAGGGLEAPVSATEAGRCILCGSRGALQRPR